MNDAKIKKLQYLLISNLLEAGRVELLLPDGMKLEIGIMQEDNRGDLVKSEDYCYVVASRDCKSTLIDSYNLGLRFEQGDDTIIYNDEVLDGDGRIMRRFDVV
jgi:hypothetical protein